eukprot:COSAG06_NODE_2820_length_6233_cov_12.699463_3_plen_128_part_00
MLGLSFVLLVLPVPDEWPPTELVCSKFLEYSGVGQAYGPARKAVELVIVLVLQPLILLVISCIPRTFGKIIDILTFASIYIVVLLRLSGVGASSEAGCHVEIGILIVSNFMGWVSLLKYLVLHKTMG